MTEFIQHYITIYGLAAIFAFMLANGLISGPPSELVLAFGGILATTTNHTILSVFCVAVAGNLLGTFVLYLIGRCLGVNYSFKLLKKFNRRFKNNRISCLFPGNRTALAMVLFIKNEGAIWVGILRCFPVIRSIISFPAGIAVMPVSQFIFWSLGGICVWASLWIAVGYLLTETWSVLTLPLNIVLLSGLAIVIYFLKKRLNAYVTQVIMSHKKL
jgi:membrane protein DedA with SNARE-associated domain